jgi:MerR family transcriptional regulator, mercuric resistance operon regulatory protein
MEDEPERLSIGELSKLTGCTTETIRFYERTGVLRPPNPTDEGRRYYVREDIQRLTLIRRARELEFTLAQARRLVELGEMRPVERTQMRAIGEGHLDEIRQRIKDLEEIATKLMALLEEGDFLIALQRR